MLKHDSTFFSTVPAYSQDIVNNHLSISIDYVITRKNNIEAYKSEWIMIQENLNSIDQARINPIRMKLKKCKSANEN